MNPGLPSDHASILFYDGDYPSPHLDDIPENSDPVTAYQGVAADVERYCVLFDAVGGPVLELCCGTGRVAIPLARRGAAVTAVDISAGMLDRFRERLARESPAVKERVQLRHEDVANLHPSPGDSGYALAILAFNSLLCVPDFAGQRQILGVVAAHLAEDGILALDIVNPVHLPFSGDPVPKLFFTRVNPRNGRTYSRFAQMGPLDAEQRQRLFGWYDELDDKGTVRRTHYSMFWRPIFRFEIELMLESVGLRIRTIAGGHADEPFTAASPRMFIVAERARL